MSNTKNTKSDTKAANKNYKVLNKNEENKTANLEVEVDFSVLSKHRAKVVKNLGKHVDIKGFRPGTAPEKMIVERIGEMKILEEMSYEAIIEIMPDLIESENIKAMTQPKITVTKIAPDNPMVFKAEFILLPEIKLADYKKIATSIKGESDTKVTDKEIDDYIEYLRKMRGESDLMKQKTSADEKERAEAAKKDKPELPEFNDDFVKTLGDFKNVDDFKKQLRENMQQDKDTRGKQKRRLEIIEKVISESTIELPDILIEEELHQMMHQFEHDIEHAKMNLDDYLRETKKTREDLLKEWRPDAIKRSKMNLIVPKIAAEEKIEADPKLVEKELEHLKHHHKDVDEKNARAYITMMLRNDAVFKFLEELK